MFNRKFDFLCIEMFNKTGLMNNDLLIQYSFIELYHHFDVMIIFVRNQKWIFSIPIIMESLDDAII